MAIITLAISTTSIKGIKDAMTAAGLVTTSYYYNADNRNWVFSTPYSDKIIQLIISNTAADYIKYFPEVYIGDAYDDINYSVTNKSALNTIYYYSRDYNECLSITMVYSDDVLHFMAPMKGGYSDSGTVYTMTFGTIEDSSPANKVVFLTTDISNALSNTVVGVSTTTGETAKPFPWNVGKRISPLGKYYAQDFLISTGMITLGKLKGAKQLLCDIAKTSIPTYGTSAACTLAAMTNNTEVINSVLLIENAI